ncbi:hydroxymethylpyrimidine/phosphomethylpyrimidine kinase [Wenyingzhuangia aestuarii]|uniref:hydroxymethylpyrimidine/phosphomethylpyrimidine kinase n=1 Tax=Wenyingzhuangia aestuarii TaxID=1647582 RepID=UPI00143B1C39|nr:hydroxymethylpyrimidine/phosphomethylpyrimidine kinase [Wenyingzhuangia aestuarii]NJB81939.1 hydroxymethylpyrimidine/phosphomethylpyrimidine kinase [Wenyingzhuangia aestuarii]
MKIDHCSLPIANCILTIAGFDPSSGAGITSDIKTFEAHNFYGLSVCTAVTVQNDIDFKNCHWIPTDLILKQIETLFERFKINIVKIGIIQSWEVLSLVLDKLHSLNSEIKIVLDPIIKATAGFDFHTEENQDLLDKIWGQCYIITPNYDEIQLLYPNLDIDDTLEHISNKTNIYLKGGHREDKKGWDELYHSGIVMVNIPPNVDKVFDKHGSGCVLSSSLACNLALEQELEDACKLAKYYVERFLNSNESLLGTHIRIQNEEVKDSEKKFNL